MGKLLQIKYFSFFIAGLFVIISSCGKYNFTGKGTFPKDIHSVRIPFIENRAAYINPQLSPTLTDRLKQKIIRQSKLSSTNNDNADLDILATITNYDVSTSGVSNTNGKSQASINRLTVSVHVVVADKVDATRSREFDVSRSFDFSASSTLQSAEATLLDEMVRNLSDEIYNGIFSDW
jgi:hypothetical protein